MLLIVTTLKLMKNVEIAKAWNRIMLKMRTVKMAWVENRWVYIALDDMTSNLWKIPFVSEIETQNYCNLFLTASEKWLLIDRCHARMSEILSYLRILKLRLCDICMKPTIVIKTLMHFL